MWKMISRLLDNDADNKRSAPSSALRVNALHSKASMLVRLSDFGDGYYMPALHKLIESINLDSGVDYRGRIFFHELIVQLLVNRLLLAEALKKTPELFSRPLSHPPLIVIGMPRTGTTFLHRILAADPRHRAITSRECRHPFDLVAFDKSERVITEGHEQRRQGFDHIHFSRPDTPEECSMLMACTFHTAYFWGCAPVFGYLDWLHQQDMRKAYREYYQLLQLLQSKTPEARLTLKSPGHLAGLALLIESVPDALIIQTHRNPITACHSFNSLIHHTHSRFAKEVNLARMARMNVDSLADAVATSLEVRDANAERIYDVLYDDLLIEPLAVARGIYEHFAIDWTTATERGMQHYVLENPQNKHGEHHYAAVGGYSDRKIAELFQPYGVRFGV